MRTALSIVSSLMVSALALPALAQGTPAAPTSADAASSTPAAPEAPAAAPAATEAPAAAAPAAPVAAEAPAAPASPDAPAAPAAQPEAPKEAQGDCLLGDICLGPQVTLGAVNPVGVGVQARFGKYFGAGFDYQGTFGNIDIPGQDAKAGLALTTIEGRVYPFGGTFFLAGGFAYQSLEAEATATVEDNDTTDPINNAADVHVQGTVGIPTLKFGLGWMSRHGFLIGSDLAANVPLGGTDVSLDVHVTPQDTSRSETQLPQEIQDKIQEQRTKLEGNVKDAADALVSKIPVIPQINLIRLGWLF